MTDRIHMDFYPAWMDEHPELFVKSVRQFLDEHPSEVWDCRISKFVYMVRLSASPKAQTHPAPAIPQATPPVQGDQPTPAGFWLAPMESDQVMEEAGFSCLAYGTPMQTDIERAWVRMRDSWLARHPAAPQVANPQPLAASEAEPEHAAGATDHLQLLSWIGTAREALNDASDEPVKVRRELMATAMRSLDKVVAALTPTASSAPKAEGEACRFPFVGYDPKFCPGSNPDNPQEWPDATQPPSEANRTSEGGDVVAAELRKLAAKLPNVADCEPIEVALLKIAKRLERTSRGTTTSEGAK